MVQTLTEAKAEREAEEKAEQDAATQAENKSEENEDLPSPQDGEEKLDTELVDDKAEELEDDADQKQEDDDKSDTEDWLKGDDHESQAEKKYTGSDIGAAKAKLRAKLQTKLDAKDSELEKLKAENEALKRVPKSEKLVRPKRDDFDESDDPDEAYTDALLDWKINENNASQQANQAGEATADNQRKQAEVISKAVDLHYEDAVKLAEKSGISAEAYHAADLKVRQAIQAIFPNDGHADAIMDGLIANLGKGSDKVMYKIGINSASRDEFIQSLRDDPNGLKAMGYLGNLKGELNAPVKRKTNAPAPSANANGDANTSGTFGAAHKKYDAAHKKGDSQEAFNIKRAAKKAGGDTSKW